MEQNLSHKEIGQKIAQLRRTRGLSQGELADKLAISRPSYTQIELGKRKLSVPELQRLSIILTFSIDNFLSKKNDAEALIVVDEQETEEKETVRISKPTLNVKKATNVLLYILEKCAGKPNVGETLIYKLLYFSDFNYYELYEEHLTGATYHKLPYGPVPHNLHNIINKMIQEDKSIQRIKTDYFNHKQTRYLPLRKANLLELKASEKEVLDRVIEQFSNWSASAISEYSHKDIPWLVSKDGEEIDYELALYRETPYTVRNYEEENEEL